MANLANFDLIGHITNEAKQTETRKESPDSLSTTVNLNADTSEKIRAVAEEIVSRGIDITDGYANWRDLGYALSDELGEAGRQLFHDLSRQNAQYDQAKCNKQYTACLHGNGSGITIATFFKLAKDAGVMLPHRERVSATSAIPPPCGNIEKSLKTDVFDHFDCFASSGGMAEVAETTFSDKLAREALPSILHAVWDNQKDAAGRDKMLLGTLNIISGLLPDALYGIYDRKKIYAPLYTLIYGPFGSDKGALEAVRHIADPIRLEMRRAYEAEMSEYAEQKTAWDGANKKERGPEPKEPVLRSPLISANSSAAMVYDALDNNKGWGAMFEPEADTLTNMLSKSEYGDYTDLLRKAHHHEACAHVRKTDNVRIEIDKPRLSILLTCTGSQIPRLLPSDNIANGLASRFLFYALPARKLEFRNVFEACDRPIEEDYKALGQQFMPLYHALEMRHDNPVQFLLSNAQQKEFLRTFNDVLREQFSMLDEGITGFIYRLGLECFRLAMILTALRRLSEWNKQDSLFDDDEQAMVCNDTDFSTAMTITECLVSHTARVYAVLGNTDNDPFRNMTEKPSEEVQRFFKALPDNVEFKAEDALEVAKSLRIAERTAERHLGKLLNKFHVITRIQRGIYIKSSVTTTA